MGASTARRRLGELLPGSWTVGEPTVHGAVAVYPAYGPPARHRFVSLAAAMRGGLVASELPMRASPHDLWIDNRTPATTLVFGGEELAAGERRVICHESWLVEAGRRTWVPICRVGDPDTRRTQKTSFMPTQRICTPRVRRYEAQLARTRGTPGYGATRAPLPGLLEAMIARERDVAETGALDAAAGPFALHDEQCGALFAIGDRFVAFDWVARSEVYADLHRRLARGCLLEAAEQESSGPAPSTDQALRWLDALREAPVHVAESKHAAHSVRPLGDSDGRARVEGAGVSLDGVLLQWSAFPGTAPSGEPP